MASVPVFEPRVFRSCTESKRNRRRLLLVRESRIEDAIQLFLDPARMEMEDDRSDYGERRFVALGVVNQLLDCRGLHRTFRSDTNHIRAKGRTE